VGAMDAGAAGAVDVELAVDGEGVAPVGGHPGRQGRVVIHLQLITLGVGDRQVLVSPGVDRIAVQGGVEGDLGPRPAGGERGMDGAVVGRGPAVLAAGRNQEG
jgi:hypothetical protein